MRWAAIDVGDEVELRGKRHPESVVVVVEEVLAPTRRDGRGIQDAAGREFHQASWDVRAVHRAAEPDVLSRRPRRSWDESLALLERFVVEQHRYPEIGSGADHEERLRVWLIEQRYHARNATLRQTRRAALEALPEWRWDAPLGSKHSGTSRTVQHPGARWQALHAGDVVTVRGKRRAEGHASIRVEEILQPALANGQGFLGNDGREYREYFYELLVNATERDAADRRSAQIDERWARRYDELRTFISGRRRMPSVSASDPAEATLARWSAKQRHRHRGAHLTPTQTSELEELPGWAWELPSGPRPRS